jgi:hypothetical protein
MLFMYMAIQQGWNLLGQLNTLRNFTPASDDSHEIALTLTTRRPHRTNGAKVARCPVYRSYQ